MFDLEKYNVLDLTMSYYQGSAGYSYEAHTTVERDGWNSRMLHFYSHAGTHMDAPLHFGASEATIDQYTARELVGTAWIARVPIQKPGQLITLADIGEVRNTLLPGESLLLQTGWSRHVGQATYRDHLPRISRELATWCVDAGVGMLGVEPPSVADVNNLREVTDIHLILLGGGVIIVEGLTNLDQIKKEKVMLVALPLKITGGDGAPARVIAFEER